MTIKLCTYATELLCTYATELFSIEQIIYIKMDLALNNLQRLICHKTKQTKPNHLSENKTSVSTQCKNVSSYSSSVSSFDSL